MTAEANELVYTLGTSTRSREEFIELLASHGVEVVVDVRRLQDSVAMTLALNYFGG